MMNGRYQPKHYAATMKDACNYCHRTPAIWHHVGNEKICSHCGTRVFNSVAASPSHLFAKVSNR